MPNSSEFCRGGPLLARCVVLWLDLLGYERTTREAHDKGESQQEFIKIYRSLENVRKEIESVWYPGKDKKYESFADQINSPFRLKAFSDNIFMGWPIGDTAGKSTLSRALRTASIFQLDMAMDGIFCRGAITIGDAYIDEITVFGMALITAVEAEKHCAHDPRIILCDSAVKVTEQVHMEPSLARYIRTDTDNRCFVNYLEVMMSSEHELAPTDEQLCKHRDAVSNKLKEFHKIPKILSKYQWVARYHNSFCDKHSKQFSELCKIPDHPVN